ncbi:unnamed protein product, partial [Amoebophrya sp. A120]
RANPGARPSRCHRARCRTAATKCGTCLRRGWPAPRSGRKPNKMRRVAIGAPAHLEGAA